MKKIALITPLRDEIDNLEKLISSIENQTVPIFIWVIVENHSTDGSKEYLEKISNVKNVTHLNILNIQWEDSSYGLGNKYSRIVRTGFDFLKKNYDVGEIDNVGILDGDIHLENSYYEKLLGGFLKGNNLGITSGLIYNESGNLDLSNKNWVRGGCRLWQKECFIDTGYNIEPSEDTISAARAIITGWKVYPIKDAKAYSREVATRINYGYYAYSAYYRGHSLVFALLKSLKLLAAFELDKSFNYLSRFLKCKIKNEPRIEDKAVRDFFRKYLYRKYSNRSFFGKE